MKQIVPARLVARSKQSSVGLSGTGRHRQRRAAHRHPLLAVTGACCALLPLGCAVVDPKRDYAAARELVTERTGVSDSFDPADEGLIAEKVDALLQDGVSLNDAIGIALLNNRGFQSAFLEIGVSRADLVQSGLLSNPTLAFSARFPEGGGRSNLTLGFAQQVADLWKIPVRKRIAEAELEQVILSVADRAVQLNAEVKRAFYQVMAAEQAEALTTQSLELVQRSLQLARARFDAGEVGQVDVNLVRGNLISVQLDAIAARRTNEEARTNLSRILGLSRSTASWKLRGSWPDVPAPLVYDDELLLAAMQQRVDATIAAFRITAAQEEWQRQCRSVFPEISLGLEGERPDRRALPNRKVLADTARASVAAGSLTAPSIQSRAERRRERSQIVDLILGPTLEITLPIWDQNQAQIAKAGYRIRQMRAAYEDLLDTVAKDVTNALGAMRAAEELARFYVSQGLPQAEESVAGARATYETGEQNVLVLIAAQDTLITRQREHVNVLRDLALAQAELERALGGPISAAMAHPAQSPEDTASGASRGDTGREPIVAPGARPSQGDEP